MARRWSRRSASSPACSCSPAGSAAIGRSCASATLDVHDRVAGRRRGPDQRRRRAGRDDPRVAPPERALRLLPLDDRQRRRPTDARFGLHGGALDRVPRPRRDGQHAGLPARGAVRCAGPLRRRDRHAGDEPPGLDIRRRGSTRLAEIDASLAVAELLTVHEPDGPSQRAGAPGSARPPVLSREPARAGRPGHDRRPGAAVLRPRRPARGRPRRPARTSPSTTPRSPRTSPRRAPRAPWPTTRPRPGATPRSPASGSGGRSRRRSSTRARTPCRSRRPTRPRGPSGRSRSRPETLVLAASDEVPLLIAHGIPGAVVQRSQDAASSSGCSARCWPSRRRWSSPSTLSGGFGR